MVATGGGFDERMRQMSILIVAPRQPALTTLDNEVAAIVSCFHRPILVQGDVSEATLQNALTDDVEGFWFAGHASERGLLLSNDYLLPVDALAQYLSSANVEWSFFNSCESGLFVNRLQTIYAHDCYAYITEIADIAAWRTASLVARNYLNVGNILRAVRSAAPAGTTPLRYFPSSIGEKNTMREERIDDRLATQMQDLTKAIYALQNEIALSEQRTKMEIILLTRRVEQIERAGNVAKPLLSERQSNRIVAALVVIALLLGYGLYVLMAMGG
jgi:hypothetical protein